MMTQTKEQRSTRSKNALRIFLLMVILVALLIGAFVYAVPHVGGAFDGTPDTWERDLSPSAKKLVDQAYAPFSEGELVDIHTHIVGLGAGGTGAKIHQDMVSWFSPVKRAKFEIYISASGVDKLENADEQFVARVVDVATHVPIPAKHFIMAFDANHTADGQPDLHHTEFFVPNSYIFKLTETHPKLFYPVISVHPYRADAVKELERLHKKGARFIKWLPNAMGIDPSNPKVDDYYKTAARLGYTIISHAGEEQAVDAEEAQKLGNPLLIRRGLDFGVRFIVAHCASLGEMEDLDRGDGSTAPAFDLFMRLMDEKKYEGLLYADISAIAQFNRVGDPLVKTIQRRDLHPRLINGSDYPLPAINALIHLNLIEDQGLLTADESNALREIYAKNPLLFDFVLKRTMKDPKTKLGFVESVFRMPTELESP